jgi:hypothetical protein
MTYSNMYSVPLFPQSSQSVHQYNIIPIYDVKQYVHRAVIPLSSHSVHQYTIIPIYDLQEHVQRAVISYLHIQSISIISYQYMTWSKMYSVLYSLSSQSVHQFNIIPIYDLQQHVQRAVIPSSQSVHQYNIIPIYNVQ